MGEAAALRPALVWRLVGFHLLALLVLFQIVLDPLRLQERLTSLGWVSPVPALLDDYGILVVLPALVLLLGCAVAAFEPVRTAVARTAEALASAAIFLVAAVCILHLLSFRLPLGRRPEAPALEVVGEVRDAGLSGLAKFSPANSTFAVASLRAAVRWFNPQGERVADARFGDETVSAFDFSRDGNQLLVGTRSGKVFLHTPATSQSKLVFEQAARPVEMVGWVSPAAAVWNSAALFYPHAGVFDLTNGSVIHWISAERGRQTVAVAPDGGAVAALFGGRVNLYDAPQTLSRGTYSDAGPLAVSVALSPDNALVAIGHSDGRITFCEIRSQGNVERKTITVPTRLRTHTEGVLAFAPDGGTLVFAAAGRTACVADSRTGGLLGLLEFPEWVGRIRSVSFSRDGRLVLAAMPGHVIVAKVPAASPAR